jgi:hypothetical protein
MQVFLAALIIFGVAIAGMAIGVILSNRRIRGSCGGLAGLRDADGITACDLCTHPKEECTGRPELEKTTETADA